MSQRYEGLTGSDIHVVRYISHSPPPGMSADLICAHRHNGDCVTVSLYCRLHRDVERLDHASVACVNLETNVGLMVFKTASNQRDHVFDALYRHTEWQLITLRTSHYVFWPAFLPYAMMGSALGAARS